MKVHVLLCESHKSDGNLKVLKNFKERFIDNCNTKLPEFRKNISCFNVVGVSKYSNNSNTFNDLVIESEITESAIFPLQTIEFDGVKLNLFFDSGCGDMVVKKSAIDKLKELGRAKLIVPGPIVLSGVGDHKSVCEEGAYSVCLPLHNGKNAILAGLCLPKITTQFPIYELGEVEKDCTLKCGRTKSNLVRNLPKVCWW